MTEAQQELVSLSLDTLRDETGALPAPPAVERRWQRFLRRIGVRRPPSAMPSPPRWYLDVESEQPFRAYILAPGGTKVLVSRKQAAQILGALGLHRFQMERRNPHLRHRRH